MRIAIADNQSLRFDKELKEYWETKHEVRYEPGASDKLFQWCDLYYVNFWDNNIHWLYKWHQAHPEVKKPKVVCRAIDWEVWIGFVRDQKIIDWVDEVICIAPHIEKRLRNEANFGNKLHLIRPGVDLSKWTLINRERGFKIIMPVNEIDWYLKHTIEGLKIFRELLDRTGDEWSLTVRGIFKEPEYMQQLIHNYIEIADLKNKVTFDTNWVDDFNGYLDNFDYMLLPSLKEAYSFVTAQCAAKGIQPVLNWWLGADGIWPKEWLYRTAKEAIEKFSYSEPWKTYRAVIEEKYDIKRMFKEYDEVCKL